MTTDQQIALAVAVAVGGIGALVLISALGLAAMARADAAAIDEEARGHAPPRPRIRLLIARALARKCPVCGRGRMFRSYLWMNVACPTCSTVFWRDEGEWLGPWVLDYTVAVVAAMLVWFGASIVGLPEKWEIALCAVVAAVSAVAVIPWSRSFWTAFLYFTGETLAREAKPGRRVGRLYVASTASPRARRRGQLHIRLVKPEKRQER